jgi:hypothetical protein
MRAECVKVQERVIALGAKAASADMEIRRHAKQCPLCKEFMQSLIQLEQTEHDLEHYAPPQDMVGGTLAKVLADAQERKRSQDALSEARPTHRVAKFLRAWLRRLLPGGS